ncbi:MAG: acyl-CoA dehydrogenase family protein [Bryobacterales bacterium]|nr:acyl-CoA dehydrogenase family protein [Bryobacterales bacterium]
MRETPSIPSHPSALPFLPLLYVAWADGDLLPSELAKVTRRISDAPLDPEARAALEPWLDPAAPPPPRALRALLDRLREASASIPEERRLTLAQLGRELAPNGVGPETLAALDAVEEALGVVSEEAARELLPGPPADEPAQAAFDVDAIRALLAGKHAATRNRVRALLEQPIFRREYGLSKEVFREQTLERLKVLAAEGLGSLSYPTEYGGEDDMAKFAVAFETIAYADLSLVIKYGVQFGLFGGAIRSLGTKPHHDRYLRDAGTVALPGCFAMTELGHGSNVAGIETTATYDPATDELVILTPTDDAHKEYIGNAACHGRLAVVFAQLVVAGQAHGVHAVVVPIRNEDGSTCAGVRIEDCGEKLGLNGVDNGRLWFDSVRVPRTNLLNRFADITPEGEYVSPIASPSKRFFTMIGTLVAGRVSVALASLSAMKSGLTIAVRYGEARRQFGPEGQPEVRLLDYLTHQRRLLPRVAEAYALDFGLKYLLERFVNKTDEDAREIETLAAGLKATATWANMSALQEARECCGGQGYMAVNRFADLKADSDIFCTFEGDNTVLLQLVVKSLLSDYKRQFDDLRAFTMLKFVVARAADAVREPSPIEARETASQHLRDAEFQLRAMRYREQRLLSGVARRLRSRMQQGTDSFDAFTECQDHLMATAKAYVERVILEQFVAAAPPELDAVRSLYALSKIEADRAWFLEAGELTTAKARAIRAEVNALCAEIRPYAVPLVAAFGIPDTLLEAPIALGPAQN